jgi:hypothetical protein
MANRIAWARAPSRPGEYPPHALETMQQLIGRSFLCALLYAVVLGAALAASCIPGYVSCIVQGSLGQLLVSEGLVVTGLALLVILVFDLIVRRLSNRAWTSDVVLVVLLALPILVPFCIGVGCSSFERAGWMILSVGLASATAAVGRRMLINLATRNRTNSSDAS